MADEKKVEVKNQDYPARSPSQQPASQVTQSPAPLSGTMPGPLPQAALNPVTPIPPPGTPSADQVLPAVPAAVGNPPRRYDVGPGAPSAPMLLPHQIPRREGEATVTMMVPRPFKWRLDSGHLVAFEPGVYEIPESLASHQWLANNGVRRHGKETKEYLSRADEIQKRREELAAMEEQYRADENKRIMEEKQRERNEMAKAVAEAEAQQSSRSRPKVQ